MFGNKQGWVLSALIALLMGWMIFKFGRVQPPTPVSGHFPYLLDKIELPTKPESVRPIFTENRDAGELYLDAAAQYVANKKLYDNLYTPKAKGFRRLDHLKTAPAIDLVVQGTHATEARIFIRQPELLVNYRYPYPELDGLQKLGLICRQLGLESMQAGDDDQAVAYFDAEFSLGKKLFDERVNSTEVSHGIGLMRDAAIHHALLAGKRNNAEDKSRYNAFDQSLKKWHETRFASLDRAVNSVEAGPIKQSAGDVFALASKSPERVWRVEALLKVGRYKYNAGSIWDQIWARRFLTEPARVGEEDPTTHPDPAVAMAARLARDLTIEGYNQIDLVD